jgi:hypothetical protein
MRPGHDDLLDLAEDFVLIDAEIFQDIGRNTAPFLHQPQQDMLGADVFVVEAYGLIVGQLHDPSGAIRQALVHGLLQV